MTTEQFPGAVARRSATMAATVRTPGWGGWLGLGLAMGLLGAATPAEAQADPPGCLGSGLGIALFVDRSQARVGDQLNYSVLVYNNPFPACKVSDVAAWIVTPNGVTNAIVLRRTTLGPGESDTYSSVASYTVRNEDLEEGIVIARAYDTGKIHQSDVLSDGMASQTVNTLITAPCIAITAECTDTEGDTGQIGFTGTVRNCGDLELTGVTVTNVVAGVARRVFGPVNVAVNETVVFSGAYTPPDPCIASTAQFIATGTDRLSPPRPVTDTVSTTCGVVLDARLALGQSCPPVPVFGGAQLTYTGSVTNTGNVTLDNVVVLSDQPAPNTVVRTFASLAPGAVGTFVAAFRAPTGQCSVTVSLQATATSRCGTLVSESSERTCPLRTRPALAVTQSCPPQSVGPGETLTFSGTVRNSGDVALANVEVFSARPAPRTLVYSVARLEPGATATFTGSYTAPTEVCSVSNTLRGEGLDACSGVLVSHEAVALCMLTPSPEVAISQECPEVPPGLGGVLTYTATVVNLGNISLTNLVVFSDRPGPNSVVFRAPNLPAGASTNFTGSYTVPATLDSCSISSTLRVSARARCTGQVVTAETTSTCSVRTDPSVRVSTDCPSSPTVPGDRLTFSGTVENTGNITLTNVVVLSDQPAPDTEVFRVASLPPSESVSFSGGFSTAPDSCSASWTLSVSGADSCTGNLATDSTVSTCALEVKPELVLDRSCPLQPAVPGQMLVFSGTVTNSGNITLANVRIVNSLPEEGSPVFGPVTLLPGTGAAFTGSYLVPADLNACEIESMLTATASNPCDGSVVITEWVTHCPVVAPVGVRLAVECPAEPVLQGGTLRFQGALENTGSITLTDLLVVNSRPVPDTVVLRVASLAPGATTNFTGTFTVPTDCCSVVSTLSVTGADLCGVGQVLETATMVCSVQFESAILLTYDCPAAPVAPGDDLRFSGHIENTGNVSLVDVRVYDAARGPEELLLGPIDLAPGERVPYSGRQPVPLDSCGVVSGQITATAEPACGSGQVTRSVALSCPIRSTPGLSVFNERLPGLVPTGVPVTGRGTLSNTGNIGLTNVVVSSSLPADGTPEFGPITLAPGQTVSFDYAFVVPEDCDCCQVTVTLTASGQDRCDGATIVSTSTALMNCQTSPRLSLALDCAGVGTPFLFGQVRNSGDITLTNVVVLDRTAAFPVTLAGPFILAPGELKSFVTDVSFSSGLGSGADAEIQAQGLGICGGSEALAVAYCDGTEPEPGYLDIRRSGSDVMIRWASTPGEQYQVQYRLSLLEGEWQDLPVEVMAIGTTTVQLDFEPSDLTRFYRVIRAGP
jgi:uncharacterized repeat protein (TIGR01451 family)